MLEMEMFSSVCYQLDMQLHRHIYIYEVAKAIVVISESKLDDDNYSRLCKVLSRNHHQLMITPPDKWLAIQKCDSQSVARDRPQSHEVKHSSSQLPIGHSVNYAIIALSFHLPKHFCLHFAIARCCCYMGYSMLGQHRLDSIWPGT